MSSLKMVCPFAIFWLVFFSWSKGNCPVLGTVTPANKSPPNCCPNVFKLAVAFKSTLGVLDLNGFSMSGKPSKDRGATSIKDWIASITGSAAL